MSLAELTCGTPPAAWRCSDLKHRIRRRPCLQRDRQHQLRPQPACPGTPRRARPRAASARRQALKPWWTLRQGRAPRPTRAPGTRARPEGGTRQRARSSARPALAPALPQPHRRPSRRSSAACRACWACRPCGAAATGSSPARARPSRRQGRSRKARGLGLAPRRARGPRGQRRGRWRRGALGGRPGGRLRAPRASLDPRRGSQAWAAGAGGCAMPGLRAGSRHVQGFVMAGRLQCKHRAQTVVG